MNVRVRTYVVIGIVLVGCTTGGAEEQPSKESGKAGMRPGGPFVAAIESGVPVKKQEACAAGEMIPNSMSPTWDSQAATTQCGALETDNLTIFQTTGAGVRQQMLVTTAKYGLTPRLEVRWGLPGRIIQAGERTEGVRGTTDQWLGACFRFHDQGRWAPDLALDYAIKIPTANPAKGFGSGYTDHQMTLIASRDVRHNHIDFNMAGTIAGGPAGHDGAAQFGLALTRSLSARLLGTAEVFGGPQPGTDDRYGAALVGGAWSLRPWLAVNGGYVRAYTAGSPRQQILLGFIYTLRPMFAPSGSSGRLRAIGR